jgi:hypothetical protein
MVWAGNAALAKDSIQLSPVKGSDLCLVTAIQEEEVT